MLAYLELAISETTLRLLVVEDDPDLNRQLTTALSDAGYVVDRAFDGEEDISRRQRAL
jgi:DNA-binding response OmpR family regulator